MSPQELLGGRVPGDGQQLNSGCCSPKHLPQEHGQQAWARGDPREGSARPSPQRHGPRAPRRPSSRVLSCAVCTHLCWTEVRVRAAAHCAGGPDQLFAGGVGPRAQAGTFRPSRRSPGAQPVRTVPLPPLTRGLCLPHGARGGRGESGRAASSPVGAGREPVSQARVCGRPEGRPVRSPASPSAGVAPAPQRVSGRLEGQGEPARRQRHWCVTGAPSPGSAPSLSPHPRPRPVPAPVSPLHPLLSPYRLPAPRLPP